MTLVQLMLRRHRVLIASWSVLLIALSGGTVSAYQTTYPTAEQRRLATELAQQNTATTLLYGRLPEPGTPALMFAWEIGAIVTILAAVMAVLLTVSLTRTAEDNGTHELVRSCGIAPRTPLRSAFAVLAGVAGALTLGCSLAIGLSVGAVDAVTWPGALTFGAVVGLTFLLFAALTTVLAQVAPSAEGAHLLGYAALGIAFILRAFADTEHAGRLNWLSPLALRATVRPFADDRWWVLAVYLGVAVTLGRVAMWLSDRREYGAGLLRRRDRRGSRLNVRSGFGLTVRLARHSVLTWTAAVACLGALFSAMGSGVVQQRRRGDLGGLLGSQLASGDPVAGYFAYSGTVVGMVVAAFAVLGVLRARQDEIGGLADHALATGVRRWEPLAWRVAVTAAASAGILVATGTLSALVVPMAMDGTDVAPRAFAYPVGQWPAAMMTIGWTALLAGVWPRLTWLAWVPLGASGVLALLGQLLGIPEPVRDLGIFQHVPDVMAAHPAVRGLGVLLAVAFATALVGVAGISRRDISPS